jgi:signal peptidase I
MLSTTLVIAVFGILLILQVALWAFFLWLGLRWARVEGVTTRRLAVVTAGAFVLILTLTVEVGLLERFAQTQSPWLGLAELAANILLPCALIAGVFRISFFRAFRAWLPTVAASILAICLVLFVMRPFIFEAFTCPTNAMAPTLLGNTRRSICPKCGALNYCSPTDPRFAGLAAELMICDNFHVNTVSDINVQIFPADRFFVAKFLTPKRWDLVVFQPPDEPSTVYVKRLVGLPGETIVIKDGALWVNDVQLDPPDSLHGIEYLDEMRGFRGAMWGSKTSPAVLGADEYFVLGDFSATSFDSRLWQQGAPGHPPYAVPESSLRGVVTHIYWPLKRWRTFR